VIVTRQRKRRQHLGRYVVPLLIVAAIGFVLGFPPSQRAIANGPLQPVWSAGANAGAVIVRPLSFAGQQDTITQRNREIRELTTRLEAERKAKEDADARIDQLQQQLNALANQTRPTPVPAPRRTAAPAEIAAGLGAGDDDKRLAATWAAMEPEKAAALVQRLPDVQASRVLARMDADSAGAIMNALPASVAARLSRAQAQVPSASGR
jgi:flagellar motility protein MotE (MotC chaperone)